MASSASRLLAWLTALLCVGCSSLGPGSGPQHVSQAPEPAAEPFRPLLVLPLPALAQGDRKGTKLETLSGRDSSIQDVLLSLFKDSDINLLVDPDVHGTATFDVKGSTVEHAFETLLRTLDLAYEWDGEFLRVRARKREMFTWTCSARRPTSRSAARRAATSPRRRPATPSGTSSRPTSRRSPAARRRSSSTAWPGPSRSRQPSVVRRMRSYLHHILHRLTAQVSIEARLLEVSLKDEFRLGIDWELLPGFFDTKKTGTLANGAIFSQALRPAARRSTSVCSSPTTGRSSSTRSRSRARCGSCRARASRR
ncbi:MAG: hypothetical protein R3F30_04930 [Planctomycetota bacterium]